MLTCLQIQTEDFSIKIWGKDCYDPEEILLLELDMTFPSREEAEEFAHKLRRHYNYPTDLCWVEVVAV